MKGGHPCRVCRAVLGPCWADAGYWEGFQASVFYFMKGGAGCCLFRVTEDAVGLCLCLSGALRDGGVTAVVSRTHNGPRDVSSLHKDHRQCTLHTGNQELNPGFSCPQGWESLPLSVPWRCRGTGMGVTGRDRIFIPLASSSQPRIVACP